jgi:hypothetical protein
VGDVNRDGYSDCIVVASKAAYLLYGNASLLNHITVTNNFTEFGTTISLLSPSQSFYDAVGVDFNGDGFSDIAVTVGGDNASIVYVFYGDAQTSNILFDSEANWNKTLDLISSTVNIAGADVNGDGCGDLIVSGTEGHIIYGWNTTTPQRSSTTVNISGISIVGGAQSADGSRFGDALFANLSALFVLYGTANPLEAVDPTTLNGTNGFVMPVINISSVASGDTNHDGISEIIVAAQGQTQVTLVLRGT